MSGSVTEALFTSLSMDNPSTLLSMDTGTHVDCILTRQGEVGRPPDINLPLLDEIHSSGQWLSSKEIDALDVSLFPQVDALGCSPRPKCRRWMRRSDTIWGAWFFFNHYFKPALKDKSQVKRRVEGALLEELDKSDLRLDLFLVQHDMENLYMWAFKERPENALGKMQLRSYMNGHQRFEELQFPFRVEKGFTRSHRMQRKQYRGLSNPQCIHGIEVVRCPSLAFVSEVDRKRWVELTGRELNFSLTSDSESFSEWRTMPCPDSDLHRLGLPLPSKPSNGTIKKFSSSKSSAKIRGTNLKLSTICKGRGLHLSSGSKNKSKILPSREMEHIAPMLSFSNGLTDLEKEQELGPPWLSSFSGAMTEASGPVTGAKTIYEDEDGYLIMVSLPLIDMHRVRVCWRNDATHGVVKIHCISTAGEPFVIRGDRTFKLTDPHPEHCPPGEFVREIYLATRIPEDAELKAFYVEASAGLEIVVPKYHRISEEREVRVFLPPQLGQIEATLS
ncbi:hypothetical protein O6H91_17G035700 [Diphasiastrum complanatum]|uniref:Uncharacterized protein n=1 Tax=Diphasiastrum complanatum TaxID=34168 RepID=A0ACC2B5T5_DIPCM|nr:hypothetical protein O6H91_17G035700 [Diphasiastrum complanatum]